MLITVCAATSFAAVGVSGMYQTVFQNNECQQCLGNTYFKTVVIIHIDFKSRKDEITWSDKGFHKTLHYFFTGLQKTLLIVHRAVNKTWWYIFYVFCILTTKIAFQHMHDKLTKPYKYKSVMEIPSSLFSCLLNHLFTQYASSPPHPTPLHSCTGRINVYRLIFFFSFSSSPSISFEKPQLHPSLRCPIEEGSQGNSYNNGTFALFWE